MKKLTTFTLTLLIVISFYNCKEQREISTAEAQAIAEEAYIYTYPILENYKIMFAYTIWKESLEFIAPLNTLFNTTILRNPSDTAVVRPNNDTYYSQAILDLRQEPMVLSVPDIDDERYYSFQLIDLYTHNFDYIGTRKTGFTAGKYLIAGPNWQGEKPKDVDKVIQSETNLAIALGRTQVYGAGDADQAQAVMVKYTLQPLSVLLGTEAPKEAEALSFPPYSPEKVKSVEFISYLNFLLSTVKPHPSEDALFQRFAKIGIGPGKSFNAEKLDPELSKAIEAGIADALKIIELEIPKLGERKNGWMLVAGAFGNRDFMQGKYITRAAAAMFGIYGNDLEEAYYPETTLDADGDDLDGSKYSYILHFEADELPPVKAFWSLTMYKLPEQLLIENEIDRYKIGKASEGLKYNEDGSLDIYIQRDNPGSELESNWLPAHDGRFSLQARFYWPEPTSLDPLYVPPVVQKVKE